MVTEREWSYDTWVRHHIGELVWQERQSCQPENRESRDRMILFIKLAKAVWNEDQLFVLARNCHQCFWNASSLEERQYRVRLALQLSRALIDAGMRIPSMSARSWNDLVRIVSQNVGDRQGRVFRHMMLSSRAEVLARLFEAA